MASTICAVNRTFDLIIANVRNQCYYYHDFLSDYVQSLLRELDADLFRHMDTLRVGDMTFCHRYPVSDERPPNSYILLITNSSRIH